MEDKLVVNEITNQMSIVIKKMLKEKHIRVDDDADDTRIILDYLDNRSRRIPQKKRNVVISQELKYKIKNKDFDIKSKSVEDIIDEFEYICQKIRNGGNLNFNLSEKIFDSREKYKDIMLNAWKIHHIHLSQHIGASKSAMKRNRSSVLLFFVVTYDMVMCLDIIEHPSSDKFFCFNLMRIIENNNWMKAIGFICNNDPNYISGSLKPIIEKDEDLTKLYTDLKVNLAFEFGGKMYCSLDGITESGDTSDNVVRYQQFIKRLEHITRKEDIFEEITDMTFNDDSMTFFIVITRGGIKYKCQCKI